MTIRANLTEFGGLPVVTVAHGTPFPERTDEVAWRFTVEDQHEAINADEALAAWLAAVPHPERVRALLVGAWPESWDQSAPVRAMAEAAPRFPALTHLFWGEMTWEECEISWIQQANLDDLVAAYGNQLTELVVRGGTNLVINPFTSPTLSNLVIETGGLDGGVVAAIARSHLPALRHLGLWLGTPEYGALIGGLEIAELARGTATPRLEYLGLKNSADPLRDLRALVGSPLLARLRILDLSKGVLGDECVAVLANPSFRHLAHLDLTHHYLHPASLDALRRALPATRIHAGEAEEGDETPTTTDPYAGRWVDTGE